MKKWLGPILAALLVILSPLNLNAVNAATSDTVILVLDTSGSMSGLKITSAIEVGQNFLATVPAEIKVGLVTFNSNDVTVIPPTTDLKILREGLSSVEPDGDTALFDGILSAINSIEPGSAARLVVLTDGDDTASNSTPADVVAAISKSQVQLDVVTVGDGTKDIGVLTQFSQAGSGRLLRANDSAQLTDVFAKAIALAPPIPSPSISEPALEATAPLSKQTTSNSSGFFIPITAALASFVSVFFPILIILKRLAKNKNIVQALKPYVDSDQGSVVKGKSQSDVDQPDTDTKTLNPQNATLNKSQAFPTIAGNLDRAGIVISAEKWVMSWVIVALVASIGFSLALDLVVMGFGFSTVACFLIQRNFLKLREASLKRKFEDQLADFLTVIASGLRAGLSFVQAVESAVGDGTGEIERQVRRALGEVQVGSSIEAALLRVAKKMGSDDLSWTISALRIQREVGGSLSKILDTASVTIRNRAELKREVRTLSAEGRLSAYVLVALPIGIFAFLISTNREYVKIFWTEPAGFLMLAMFILLVTAGWFWVRTVVTVKV